MSHKAILIEKKYLSNEHSHGQEGLGRHGEIHPFFKKNPIFGENLWFFKKNFSLKRISIKSYVTQCHQSQY
jgi:hypothetical protein